MGEVWRARDSKLGREVAIKTLPEEFAKDEERLARFEREAKLLASLNHPNIAAIYGLEEDNDTRFLVLELVEGDTLADRLTRGAIPVEGSLKLGLQIAEALEAAHEKGVIHRDLKPANIKITPDGKVKVLDFGLAKAFMGDGSDVNVSQSPTLSMAATQQGVILGTAAYMSPEQARGQEVDKRADVWAFGCVLYEMLTGRQTWAGPTVTDMIAAAVAKDPDFTTLPVNIHPRIQKLLRRCLEKEPKNRWQAVGDVRIEIAEALTDPAGAIVQPITDVVQEPRPMLAWLLATLLVGSFVTGVAVWKLKPEPPHPVTRFDYELPEGQQFGSAGRPLLAMSPDGSQFVYHASGGLFLRPMDELEVRLISDTEEAATSPFFSPAGDWIGYWSSDGQLKKVSIDGGAPVVICDADDPFGVSWGSDGAIVYGQSAGVMLVSSNGGTPELVIKAQEGEQVHGPQVLPGGDWVLFTVATALADDRWDQAQVVVESLESGERKVVLSLGTDARYVPTGHLLYAVEDVLLAVPFDIGSLEVTGGPVSVVANLMGIRENFIHTGTASYDVSDTGSLSYVSASGSEPPKSLVWVDRDGNEEAVPVEPRLYIYPRISPDGTKVALDDRREDDDIWIWDFVRENLTRFTFTPAADQYSVWTSGSERIVYGSDSDLVMKTLGTTGGIERLGGGNLGAGPNPYFFSLAGTELVFGEQGNPDTGDNIGMISIASDADVDWLLQTEFNERNGELSPDGRWMAYQSDESGKWEIYVRSFPNVEGRSQVSNGGGIYPLWSQNGQELFCLEPGAQPRLMTARVETGATFNNQSPEPLLDWPYLIAGVGRTYDVSPNGQRFLALTRTSRSLKINVVLNWFEELKERVPVP